METVLFLRWRGDPRGGRRRAYRWYGQVHLTKRAPASGKPSPSICLCKSTKIQSAGRPFAGKACGRPVGRVNSGQILRPSDLAVPPVRPAPKASTLVRIPSGRTIPSNHERLYTPFSPQHLSNLRKMTGYVVTRPRLAIFW